MELLKNAIKKVIAKKCGKCRDISFCKLPGYYKKIESPKLDDFNKLKNCLYFRSIHKEENLRTSWL